MRTSTGTGARHRLWGVLATVVVAAAACGGGGGGGGGKNVRAVSAGPPDEGAPKRGGEIVMALDAETGGGFCLPTAQLALGGIYVATTIYDTLTVPNETGTEFVPWLAESVTHNDTYDEWTVKLRDGVRFHNGEALTAEVVKQNLDAFRAGLLFQFVFSDVADVQVVDPLTVRITTKRSWVTFDAYLFSSGRAGIAAPEQLADEQTCSRELIGTGPYRLVDWNVNEKLVVEANPDYWYEGLPYLDRITFRPIPERAQRVNGLLGGELDLIFVTEGTEIEQLRREADAGKINVVESGDLATLAYTLLNVTKPPFDNETARLAFAHAVNREERNEIINNATNTIADQPFTEDDPAYVDPREVGFPHYDPDRARELVRQYEQETGENFRFTLGATPETNVVKDAEILQSQLEEAGMEVEITTAEQAAYINDALAGNFQANLWANFHGGDPDTSYVWWYAGSPVNFSRFDDPEINEILDRGRSETDPKQRKEIYSALSKEFAEGLYNIWSWYGLQSWGMQTNVRGLYGVEVPAGGGLRTITVNVAPTIGLWLDR